MIRFVASRWPKIVALSERALEWQAASVQEVFSWTNNSRSTPPKHDSPHTLGNLQFLSEIFQHAPRWSTFFLKNYFSQVSASLYRDISMEYIIYVQRS